MALIQWSGEYSVGVEEIDREHQGLIRIINELNDAMRQGKGKEVLGKIIDGLLSYTRTHFTTEEKHFDRLGYPETDAHKVKHAEFVKKASDFRNQFSTSRASLSIPVMDFLSDWLKNHILGSDKKYGPFFREKGLK